MAETRGWTKFEWYFINTNTIVLYFYMSQYLIITEMQWISSFSPEAHLANKYLDITNILLHSALEGLYYLGHSFSVRSHVVVNIDSTYLA